MNNTKPAAVITCEVGQTLTPPNVGSWNFWELFKFL